ncbi:Uncharacterized protein FWK35_00022908 [Aphis craccivora]|uniref:Cyclin-like domain-containing protein n=1 Tax=Aphis craccivora TaxID=307492 RepID=A0A6G0ZHT6_APHCR|nr:Uncharacterized protein FWK35_00022908 [Aphis craccivora]
MYVCEEQKCQEDIFPLAVNYMDRFLSVNPINKNHLQLLGTTCLLVSSKLRESDCLSVDLLVLYTDNTITSEELLVSHLLVIFFRLSYHNSIESNGFDVFLSLTAHCRSSLQTHLIIWVNRRSV